MGQPPPGYAGGSAPEYIGRRSERGEVKHLSTPRKRKRSDSLSSGERKGNSLNLGVYIEGLRDRNMGSERIA